MSPRRVAIAPARRVAYRVLRRTFEADAFTDRAFAAEAARERLADRELAQARRLAYGATQRRGTSDHLLELLAGRRPAALDPPALAALRLGLFELLFSATPDHAAVDQAVELAQAGMRRDGSVSGRARAAAGLVNAVLRRAADERASLLAALDDSDPEGAAVAHSYPPWLARMWWSELGPADARSMMAAMNEPAETVLRVNTLRARPDAVAAELRAAGVDVVRGPGDGSLLRPAEALVVGEASDAVRARVATGELVPQSRGSQAVVAILDPRPGERVLDLCAGPGIKTTQIAARLANRGEVRSLEIDAGRAAEASELCTRAGASCVEIEVADASEADLGSGYDRVLVDAPCSDLGALASRPDARWRKSPETIERLAALQRRVLVRAARALAPGGALVYSTCTISAAENESVVGAALERVPGLVADPLGVDDRAHAPRDRRFLQLRPDRDRTTGFFIARLRQR